MGIGFVGFRIPIVVIVGIPIVCFCRNFIVGYYGNSIVGYYGERQSSAMTIKFGRWAIGFNFNLVKFLFPFWEKTVFTWGVT